MPNPKFYYYAQANEATAYWPITWTVGYRSKRLSHVKSFRSDLILHRIYIKTSVAFRNRIYTNEIPL